MPSTPVSREAAAQSALETLQALRRHVAACQQCRISQKFCDTYAQYTRSFEADFAAWERAALPHG